MHKKFIVKLKPRERNELLEFVQNGTSPAKALTHARILLKADSAKDQPGWTDEAISEAFDTSLSTVARVREIYVREGLNATLERRSRSRERSRRLDGRQEAQLITLACSKPPAGREHWTLRLLADRMVELEYVDELSYETVRRTLKKTNLSLG